VEKDRGLEGWRVGGVAKNLRSKRAKDLEKKGFKESEKIRVQGVKDSRGQVEKDRGLEGWRVGGLATPLPIQTSNLLREKRDSYTSNLLTLQPSTHLPIYTSKHLKIKDSPSLYLLHSLYSLY